METPSRFTFSPDGSTTVFQIPVQMKGDNYVRIDIDNTTINDRNKFDLVNNSVVFVNSADVPAGSQLDILVVQTDEGIANLGNINSVDIVAQNILSVGAVATDIAAVVNNSNNIAAIQTVNANMPAVLNAVQSATDAAASEAAAAVSEAASKVSENASKASENASKASENAASASETAAAGSASAANTSLSNALAAELVAIQASSDADTSKNAAKVSEDAAKASENASKVSETAAAASETAAAASETAAANSASNASTSASNAATSATAASNSQVAAAASAASAASAYDSFDDRYLGSKASDPTLDNDGNPLVTGAMYFNTTLNAMQVYDGGNWITATSAGGATLLNYNYTATAGQTTFSGADDNAATLSYTTNNLIVTLNGIVLEEGTDYTASNGTSIVLSTGASVGDELNIVAFKAFTTADMVPASTGGTFSGNVAFTNNIDVTGTATASAFVGDGSSLTGVDPFKYNAVSGATQALDVGTYNFFDAGTLTADTTVSFSSVPTEARWTYTASLSYSAATPWDTSSLALGNSFSVLANTTGPRSLTFKPDGTAMYIIDALKPNVDEYSLSTAWNVSTASYVQSFSISAQESIPDGLFFKPDGTAMYVVGTNGDDVNEYSLSTAWDVSTASYVRVFSVAAQEANPTGLFFKPDGTAMYVCGRSGDAVNEYSLSTAWDVSTASYVRVFSVATQEATPLDVFFKPDGTSMYVIGSIGDAIHEYSLSTAWNISTASHVGSTSTANEDTNPYGFFFKPDGTTVYVSGGVNTSVFEYFLGTPNTLTLPSSVQNPPTEGGGVFDVFSYTFITADGGTTVKLINEEVL